jgi:Tfp pilus assembly protein PilN
MMNINLNLLPTAKKNRLESTINFLLIKNIVELFLMVIAVMTAILVWGWVFLEKDFADLTQTATLINREYYSYNQDAKNINGLIKNVNLASKKFSPVIPRLTEISNTLPSDIKLSSLQIDLQAQTITLTGNALSRSSLLNYQEVLNNIPWITNVVTPPSQLFQKENVKFEFSAKLKN